MIDPKASPEQIQAYLKELSEKSDLPVYKTETTEDIQVNIRPDKTIAQGLFKEDPLLMGGFKAHPITIRAVRKDIFFADMDFIDLEIKYQCQSCRNELDLQFWHFCPFCEASFPKEYTR